MINENEKGLLQQGLFCCIEISRLFRHKRFSGLIKEENFIFFEKEDRSSLTLNP
jgi:hypothetical protein